MPIISTGPNEVNHRHVGGITPPADHDAADPVLIVARIEREPSAIQEHLHPGAEVHRSSGIRHADVGQIAEDIPGWDVHRPAQRDREMREVTAHADPTFENAECRVPRRRTAVLECGSIVDPITNRLDPRPTRLDRAERRPGEVGDLIGFAVATGHEEVQDIVGKVLRWVSGRRSRRVSSCSSPTFTRARNRTVVSPSFKVILRQRFPYESTYVDDGGSAP